MEETVIVACIMDCPTITVHAGKCYKALIIQELPFHYSDTQHINTLTTVFKTPIQPPTAKLNTANGSLVIALGMIALHLKIVDFKCTHVFVICNRLPDTELIFGIDIQKKFSISYVSDKGKNCYIQRDGKFLTYTRTCEQKATIGIVKLTLKIPPRHNSIVPIKITGQTIKEHMAYIITDEDFTKGRHPNINIINGIPNIKGKTSVNVLVSNYTNKHIKFNKGEYMGCLEPAIEDSVTSDTQINNLPDAHSTNSITFHKMMAEQVQPDTFNSLCHKLRSSVESKLDALLILPNLPKMRCP